MEKFKSTLRKRIMIGAFIIIISIAENILTFTYFDGNGPHFFAGLLTGISIVVAVYTGISVYALKKPEILKKMMIRETDERNNNVKNIASRTASVVYTVLGVTAGGIASFYDENIALAILSSVVVLNLIQLFMVFWYDRKL